MNPIPWLVVIGVVALAAALLVPVLRRRRQRVEQFQHSLRTTAEVLSLRRAGAGTSGKPQMEMTLKVGDGPEARELTLTEALELNAIPRVGDRVLLMVDTRDPSRAMYWGQVSADMMAQAPRPTAIDLSLIGDPHLHIADVLLKWGSNPVELRVRLFSVLEAPRETTLKIGAGEYPYAVGNRMYLMEDSGLLSLVPLSRIGGRASTTANARLDPLVLGPQLLHHGATGKALILEAKQIGGEPAYLRKQGRQRWFLRMRITPDDASEAWEHSDTLLYSSAETAARICVQGLTVPVRYSPVDRTLMMTDPLAMGLPDPFVLQIQAWNDAVANGTVDAP